MSETKTLTVRAVLDDSRFKAQIERALPKHLTADRFLRIAATATLKTPKLLQCDTASVTNALLTCSQLGIEPDGRRAHLIPYGTTCTLIIDYKGLVELAMRSGEISNLHADVVCENDEFNFDLGEIKAHKVDYRKPRGEVFAVYALARFKDGSVKAEVMTRDEVEDIRKRSRSGNNGPWVTDWREMAKKTVFRRLAKWLPLSSEQFNCALEVDDEATAPVNVTPEPEPTPARAVPVAANEPSPLEVAANAGGANE